MAKLEISKVHDAYVAPGECPLCVLLQGAESIYLASFQHSRVMEPNVRVKTNASGFCPDHYRKLYAGENKLGLALVVHTHLLEQLPRLAAVFQGSARPARRGRERGLRGRSGTGAGGTAARGTAPDAISTLVDSCFLCDLLREDMQRYCFTILYLWAKDPGFPPVFRSSRGFCLPHFRDMCAEAQRSLRPDRREAWLHEASALMAESFTRLEKDLLAFTQLFRDSNRGLGSDAERTALARTLQKLAGGQFRLE